MPKKRSKRRSRSKRKVRKRPYKLDKKSRALRRYRKRRHAKSKVHGHHKRARDEAEMTNYLLHQILKTASAEDGEYNYNPRHFTRDPEYKFSTGATKEFKRGVPAPDTHFWRPQGTGAPTHRQNYPGWKPKWEYTYGHPHEGGEPNAYPFHWNDPAGVEIYDHLR